ncbi:VWA domain-containing protein [Candidatus Bipolaricaulota bacterium]|nr:VWA domain-containing protein [Candidatus Bipolaricaulota bacterium]
MLKTWKSAMTMALACSLAVLFAIPIQAAVETNLTQIISTKYPVIECYVLVRDDTGSVVPNLAVENFKITEQSSAEDQPTEESSIDLDYASVYSGATFALLIDCSGSMSGQPLIDAKTAVSTFVNANLTAEDRAAIVSFGSPAQFHALAGFTSDKAALLNEIEPMTAEGNTALYGSICEAVTKINEETGIKAIIVFTDGKSEGDTHTKDQAIELAKSSNVPVYTIALGNENNADVLKEIAAGTGGYYTYAPTAPDLGKIYADIAEKARGQYVLAYTTHNPSYDDTIRTVTVTATVGTDTSEDTGTYPVRRGPIAPEIALHDDTLNLISRSQIDPITGGSSLEIKAWVDDDISVQTVRLFYRTAGSSSAYNEEEMSLASDGYYQSTVPATAVTSPGVDFYITASDGTLTSTSPLNAPVFFPHQIAVLPNHFPVITHTPVTQAKEGEPITIEAEIADPDAEDQVEAWLYWRQKKHVFYNKTRMESTTENHYKATIPSKEVSDLGIDYYLIAADTHETRAYDGSDIEPYHIAPTPSPTPELFSFEDTFDLRPRPEWDTANGSWTVINHCFTALETDAEKWYRAMIDVPELINYKVEADVFLGNSRRYDANQLCAVQIYMLEGAPDEHGIWFNLWGRNHKAEYVEVWTNGPSRIIKKAFSADPPVHMAIEIRDGVVIVWVNEEEIVTFFDPQHQETVRVGLALYYGKNEKERTTVDNFVVEEMP